MGGGKGEKEGERELDVEVEEGLRLGFVLSK